MNPSTAFAVRGSLGINLCWGPPKFGSNELFNNVLSKSCRFMVFSPSGDYFAYINGTTLYLLQTKNWEIIATIENTKCYHLSFSPKGTYLCSWEPFIVNSTNPQGLPNLHIYKSENGKLLKSFVQKKQIKWEPLWSSDETLFSRLVNSDVIFYDLENFNVVNKIHTYKVVSYSISPTIGTYYILCHTQGSPGQPSIGRLFNYPLFENQQSVANKSFFQCDKVEFYWNSKGSHVLLLTMTEVDKTGGSYYGKQGLHFISTSGETAMVTMNKEGPIYNVEWSPKNTEFCVVYGFMPARASIFNLKCEIIHEFGASPRNSLYYNTFGNILLLAGFGNLRGHIELWDTNSKKLIGKCEAPDTTVLQWSPDGTHFITATTAPRLRIGNGYKVWHYSGALIHEQIYPSDELYEVSWQTVPKGTFKEPTVTSQKVEGIVPSIPQPSKEAYRPPSARNRPPVQFNLHDDESGPAKPSKAALKQKKKRENKKARNLEEKETSTNPPITSNVTVVLTGDEEKDKKIKNIKKKLDAIAKLKDQQAQGKTLEINQIAKVKAEEELLTELNKLQM
ncbi:hypothetical protein RN001_008246 [Aquatica leii]|uniref:Eukaryotic translation initiation factor 2A n=1 Tax=Aquatica leii TaxID=1421715 RepID=A0AAN7Q502_9COLE|nr:hypothetical protein RN001_008246 [Aquatica leii]